MNEGREREREREKKDSIKRDRKNLWRDKGRKE